MYADTIAAVSTPVGAGGIGIVRLSGPAAPAILLRLFVRRAGRSLPPGWQPRPRYFHHGFVRDPESGEVVDEVLAVYMLGPHTYTAEDVVEIHCHGGPLPVQRVLELILRAGARPAQPGEFTLRAFLNGRLDLAQAESVLDIIRARTGAALRVAVEQLEGSLSRRVCDVRRSLIHTLAYLTARIDFVDDEIPPRDVRPELLQVRDSLATLLSTARQGRLYREGVHVAIVGRPNVGKSSLFNALLGHERAIVTAIPGTTRDTIEEAVSLRGVPFYLVDTAGIAAPADPVERLGIERSHRAIGRADLVLFVLDASVPLLPDDEAILSLADKRPALLVLSKCDLPAAEWPEDPRLAGTPEHRIRLSTFTGAGLDDLRAAMYDAVASGAVVAAADAMVTNPRHVMLLEQAQGHLDAALATVKAGLTEDFAVVDVEAAVGALGLITGETADEALLDSIFSQFCLGK